jgi:hypothetical protein
MTEDLRQIRRMARQMIGRIKVGHSKEVVEYLTFLLENDSKEMALDIVTEIDKIDPLLSDSTFDRFVDFLPLYE